MRKILVGILSVLLILPAMAVAQEATPTVYWKDTTPIKPLAQSGAPGDDIELTGKLCVASNSPVGYTGTLRFQIWGTGDTECRVVCGWKNGGTAPCYDFEACNGQRCSQGDVVCLTGWPDPTDTVCDAYGGGTCDPSCGANCDTNVYDKESPEFTLSPGECHTYSFRTSVENDWENGHYVAVLQTIHDYKRILDVEARQFTVGIPRVDVQILALAITVGAASLLGAAAWTSRS